MQNDQNGPAQPTINPQPTNLNYDFITSPKLPKQKKFNLGGLSIKAKLLMAGIGIIFIWIILIIYNAIFSQPLYNTADFVGVLQDQTELIHIFGTDAVTNQEQSALSVANQNLVYTANLVFSSDQISTLSFLQLTGTSVSPSQLSAGIIPSYDTELNNSLQTNEFNQIFDQIVSTQLKQYLTLLTKTYASTTDPNGRILLRSEYNNVKLIYKQINLNGG